MYVCTCVSAYIHVRWVRTRTMVCSCACTCPVRVIYCTVERERGYEGGQAKIETKYGMDRSIASIDLLTTELSILPIAIIR